MPTIVYNHPTTNYETNNKWRIKNVKINNFVNNLIDVCYKQKYCINNDCCNYYKDDFSVIYHNILTRKIYFLLKYHLLNGASNETLFFLAQS